MKVALAISDLAIERAILHHVADSGGEVVRRCLTPAEADHVPDDVDLLLDAGFERRHGAGIRRRYRVVDGVAQLDAMPAHGSAPLGRLSTFAASSCGSGATTTALYSAALDKHERILAIDADLWHPNLTLFAATKSSPRGVMDVLQGVSRVVDAASQWTSNVWVLGGVDAPSRRHQITEEAWRALLESACREFDDVRVDIGGHLADDHPVIASTLAGSETCVLVTGAHPRAAVRTAAGDALARSHCQRVVHVLNQMDSGPIGGTAHRMLAASISQPVDIVVPFDREGYDRAFIDGVPLPSTRRGSSQQALMRINEALGLHFRGRGRRTGSRRA